MTCSLASADFPADLRFFTVRICAAGTSSCVPLQDPSGDHSGGSTELRVARSLDRRFTVDARLDPSTDYDVTVTGYSGPDTGACTPYAVGHANGVRFGRDDVQVRLYPLGHWSCAGTHEGMSDPVKRALHQAVLLPNHEVLILGGVVGPHPGAISFMLPSLAQPIVEVFDPQDARFHQVTMVDEDGRMGFSRVLFEARYIRTNEMGQYEIHTYGGFDISHVADGGLTFDANTIATPLSVLFGPSSPMMMGADAGFRTDSVILYDPVTRTASVTSHMAGNYTTTAASDGSGPVLVVRGIDSVTLNSAHVPASFGVSAVWAVDGGAQGTLRADRLGASITAISPSNFLVWGGHMASSTGAVLTTTMPNQVLTLAGEVVNSSMMGMTTQVSGHDPSLMADDNAPLPTAYHTATHVAGPMGSTSILFAGGAMVQGGSGPLARAPYAHPSMTVARFNPDGSIAGPAYRFDDRISTVLHTADVVDASGTDTLLVGGATSMTGSTLYGETVTGIVRYHPGATPTYSWVPLPSLVTGRCGHTTTIIPDHGVLVVGGITRTGTDGLLTIEDNAEFLLWEDLTGAGVPAAMNCAMATDAGMPMDAGRPMLDSGPAPTPDANVDANRHDTGPAPVDAGGNG